MIKSFWVNVVIFLVTIVSPLYAWDTLDGIVICTAANNQISPLIVSDSSGGSIIVWTDGRNGASNFDIYAQGVDSTGLTLWTTNGVAICTASNSQEYPAIISDEANGAIIAWEDYRPGSTNSDIYAQRVNSQGSTLWTNNGVAICNAASYQYNPQLVSDGAGGAIIVWADYRGGSTGDIYAQRINSTGSTLWTHNGVVICNASNDQGFPVIVSDDSGGAVIAWQDQRNGSNYNIYAQRVNSNGSTLWTGNGVAICTSADEPNEDIALYAIAEDGTSGAIITWEDYRFDGVTSHVYAQRINANGSTLWTTNGVAVCTADSYQNDLEILGDGAGDAIITWADARNGVDDYDIYAQSINSTGSILWTTNGVIISAAANDQISPMIASDGSGGAIISWTDYREDASNLNNGDIYAQRVTSQGSTLWTTDGVPICTAVNNQIAAYAPAIISDGNGGAVMTWYDARNSGISTIENIYAQSVEANGFISPPPPDAGFFGNPTSGNGGSMTVYFTDTSDNLFGDSTTWNWDFGDGSTDTTENPSHDYGIVSAPTTYTVQLVVTTDYGTSTSIQPDYISVTEPPPSAAIDIPPAWTQLIANGNSLSAPTVRYEHTAVYDTTNNRMIIFGGYSEIPGFTGQGFNDVWVLKNANGLGETPTWTRLSPTPDPTQTTNGYGGLPPIRFGHTAVYDATNNRMIIFGGEALLNYVNDVWVLSNANGLGGIPAWTLMTTTGSIPSGRYEHTAVYDTAHNLMTIYGGTNGSNALDDGWVLSNANGLGGTPAWVQITTSGSVPSARYLHSATYDVTNNLMTIFGGKNDIGLLSDVWVLNNANGQGGTPIWTQIITSGIAQWGHTAIYDSVNNLMTIFGGNVINYPNSTWVLNHANGLGGSPAWTEILTNGPQHAEHSAVYDANNNRMTIFGGVGGGNYLNDVWVLSDANGLPDSSFSGYGQLTVSFIDGTSYPTISAFTTWTWDFGDGVTTTVQSPTYVYPTVTAPTSYTVQLAVQTNFGYSTATAVVNVSEPAPTVSFSVNPNSGDGPYTATFIDTSNYPTSSSFTTFQWIFGDGSNTNFTTSTTTTHQYTAVSVPTTYTAWEIVSTSFGVNSSSQIVSVTEAGPSAFFSASSTSGHGPLPIQFTDNSNYPTGSSFTTWAWDFGDGVTTTIQNPSHVYATVSAPTIYTVRLIVTTPFGTSTATKTDYISVTESGPNAGFIANPSSGNGPLNVSFQDTSGNLWGSSTTWSWDFGDGNTGSGMTTSHTYSAVMISTTYTARLIVTTNFGSSTATHPISVTEPGPSASFSGTPLNGYGPLTVNFTDNSNSLYGNSTSWNWSFGDGGTSAIENPSHDYGTVAFPTTYTVRLIVTTNFGTSTATKTNYISVSESIPVAGFTANTTFGYGDFTVNFTDLTNNEYGSSTTWNWTFGDGSTSNVQNPQHVYLSVSTTTSYTVRMIVTTPFGTSTATRTNYITVTEPAPIASFIGTPLNGYGPLTVYFTDSSYNLFGNSTSWNWDFGDGSTSNIQNPSHIYEQVTVSTSYNVQLIVTTNFGTSTSIQTNYVQVSTLPAVEDWMKYSPNSNNPFDIMDDKLYSP